MLRFILVFLAATALVNAQETRGSIAGQVLDPAAAVVAGCSVVVTNTDTNVPFRLTTNSVGYYEANLLLPGNYEVAVKAEGFKQYVRKGISLPVATRLEINAILEVGVATDSVSVTAEAPLLDTTTASSGRVIDSRSLSDLPILNNMSLLLANLAPGVQTPGINSWVSYHSGGGGLQYSVNGGVGGNDFSVDGVPNPNGRQSAYIPHTEAVEEFKLETSGFDASMGHSTGANVAMMTKAGTNTYHGSLTETYWNQRWQAASFFVRQKHYRDIAAARAAGNTSLADRIAAAPMLASGFEHNYAATLGGPVIIPKIVNGRNKLFFFLAYNGFTDSRAEEANTLNRTVPGLGERTGDFSALLKVDPVRYQIYDPLSAKADPLRNSHIVRTPFAGNIIPANRIVNPMVKAYTGFYPKPNNSPVSPTAEPTNNYLARDMRWNLGYKSISNRLDYQFSEKHRFFARWNWFHYGEERSDWTYETAPGMTVNAQRRGNGAQMIDWTYTRSATTMFDFAVNNSERIAYFEPVAVLSGKPSDIGLPAYMDTRAGALHGIPVLNVGGYATMSQSYPPNENNRVMSGKADVFHNRGRHTLRAGFDYRNQIRTRFDGGTTSGSFTFDNIYTRKEDDGLTPAGSIGHSWAAFMMGVPTTAQMAYVDSYATANPYFGWYGQDNWRITPKLSLTLGLRMEYERAGTERFNRAMGPFDPTLALPIAAGAQAAYAKSPITELSASNFKVLGGSTYTAVNGQGRNWWPNEMMFLPRFAFAYEARKDLVIRGGYGLFYDTNNTQNITPDQSGFTRSTSTTFTNDFGQNWLVGDPRNGISPMSDPFPVRSDGTRFDEPTRSSLGAMAKVGRGWTYLDPDLKHARQQRWRIGAQKQLGANHMFEAAYSGTFSDRITMEHRLSALPGQYWNTAAVRNNDIATSMNANVPNPFYIGNFAGLKTTDPLVYQDMATNSFYTSKTIAKHNLLRAFPQMNGLVEKTSIGEAKTHTFEASYTHRFSHGLMFQGAYTRMYGMDRDFFYNEFDAAPSWRTSNNSRPHRFTALGVYELPFGKGRKFVKDGWLGFLAGGWQVSGTYEFQPGPVINWADNVFYYGNIEDIASKSPTFDQWFNTANFERTTSKTPASFQARVFPYRIDNLRQDHTSQLNANVQREFVFYERVKLLLRLDALNAFNRSQMEAPNLTPVSSNFGRITSQTASQNRFIQIQGRLRF